MEALRGPSDKGLTLTDSHVKGLRYLDVGPFSKRFVCLRRSLSFRVFGRPRDPLFYCPGPQMSLIADSPQGTADSFAASFGVLFGLRNPKASWSESADCSPTLEREVLKSFSVGTELQGNGKQMMPKVGTKCLDRCLVRTAPVFGRGSASHQEGKQGKYRPKQVLV